MILSTVFAVLSLQANTALSTFDFVGTGRTAQLMVGPDEPAAVRAAVEDLRTSVRERTGVLLGYSGMSSAAARRVFQTIPPEPVSRDLGVDGKGYDGG